MASLYYTISKEFNVRRPSGAWNQNGDKILIAKHSTPSDYIEMQMTANENVISLSFEGASNDRTRDVTMNRIMQVMPYLAQHMRDVMPLKNKRAPIINMHTHALDGKYTLMHFTIKESNLDKYGCAMIEAFLYALRRCDLADIARMFSGYLK